MELTGRKKYPGIEVLGAKDSAKIFAKPQVKASPASYPPAPLRRSYSNASIDSMATITIRQLDEKTKTRLRVRAAHHGRSMEEEAREILRSALQNLPVEQENLSEAIRRRFAKFGGIELELPQRDAGRATPKFLE